MRSLRDLDDPQAYVAKVLTNGYPGASPAEREELIAAGLAYLAEVEVKLPCGRSLRAAVAPQLANRIRDEWRRQHPEYRRNAKAGTATMLPTPTGLAHDAAIGAAAAGIGYAVDPRVAVERRLAFLALESPQDLRNPARFL
jgi:hypothetical protein